MQLSSPLFPRAVLACALVGACSAPGNDHEARIDAPPDAEPMPAGEESGRHPGIDQEDERTAIELIESGDYEGARVVLDGLLVQQYLIDARADMERGLPEDGLVSVDKALKIDPRNAEVRLLKADGSLMLGEKGIAEGKGPLLIEGAFVDALDFYRLAGDDPRAVFGASRAAYFLRDYDESLRLATLGLDALTEEQRTELSVVPERILSEAAFGAYVEAKTNEGANARDRFTVAEDALSKLLGRTSDDPWVWSKLSDLYEWEEMFADARGVVERGLARVPDDIGLLDRLGRVATAQGGGVEAIQAFTTHAKRHAELPIAQWRSAMARFDHATAQLAENEYLPGRYEQAEAAFVRCRTLAPEYAESCKAFEVMCRNGVGWCRFQMGELAAAEAAFKSMDDVVERGMEWEYEGRLLSGVLGLGFVGGGYNDKSDWVGAAEIFEYLSAYQPDNATWANNAGFFLRDAAVDLEFVGRRLCRAAHGEVTDEAALTELRELANIDAALAGSERELDLFARAANETMSEARALMVRSGKAYLDAARLAPDDVRVVNDTALVHIYYLHTRLEESEQLLLRCVEMGRDQLAALETEHAAAMSDDSLTKEARQELEATFDDRRYELKNAWGDAFQNLGVLHANHRDDKVAAERWFQQSMEIGPDPRPMLASFWVPYLRGELEPTPQQETLMSKTWAEPCVR